MMSFKTYMQMFFLVAIFFIGALIYAWLKKKFGKWF